MSRRALESLRVLDRVVHARRGDHPGEQGRLGRADGGGGGLVAVAGRVDRRIGDDLAGVRVDRRRDVVGAEVGPHRRLDAVGAVAEVDAVEVLGQDLLLASTGARGGRRAPPRAASGRPSGRTAPRARS